MHVSLRYTNDTFGHNSKYTQKGTLQAYFMITRAWGNVFSTNYLSRFLGYANERGKSREVKLSYALIPTPRERQIWNFEAGR